MRPTRRGDHSSGSRFAPGLKRPTRGSSRAGPALPSYLALHHAGFAVPRTLPPGRWALAPPFHPCLRRQPVRTNRRFCLPFVTEASERRRYFFCGTFRSRALADSTPWRYQARCPAESGLSSKPAVVRCRLSDHPACPPPPLYAASLRASKPEPSDGGTCGLSRFPRRSAPGRPASFGGYFCVRSFLKAASSRMGTPSVFALSCFEPGSAPTTM